MSDNESLDLQDLLNKPMSDYPDLPNLPAGKHVFGRILGMSADKSPNKGTPYYDFSLRLTDPGQDWTDAEKAALGNSGFSLSDYTASAKFYILPTTMRMFRRFLVSLGFPENASFREALSLDQNGIPTPASIEKVRGLEVVARIPAALDDGRVFLNNMENVAGVKKS